MNTETCRWGILGTAGIACKNWLAISNAENAQLIAVGSRSVERAREWIDACQAEAPVDPPPRAVGSYEELIAAEDIDALYIPLPSGPRKEWILKAVAAGKHVLAEKPAGINPGEVEEILAACAEAGVQYMEGVMYMHSARLPAMRRVLDDPERLGALKRIATGFSFCAPEEFLEHNIRLNSDLEPLGCLGDLGWYNIRFSLWVMNYQMPERVSGRILTETRRADSPEPVPLEFSGELFFPGGVSATYYCSFITEHQQWAHVSGTGGYLRLDDFVLPWLGDSAGFEANQAFFDIRGCHFNMENHTDRFTVDEHSNSHPDAQETGMFRKFSGLVLGGTPDPFWGEIALKTQRVLDACLASAHDGGAMKSL